MAPKKAESWLGFVFIGAKKEFISFPKSKLAVKQRKMAVGEMTKMRWDDSILYDAECIIIGPKEEVDMFIEQQITESNAALNHQQDQQPLRTGAGMGSNASNAVGRKDVVPYIRDHDFINRGLRLFDMVLEQGRQNMIMWNNMKRLEERRKEVELARSMEAPFEKKARADPDGSTRPDRLPASGYGVLAPSDFSMHGPISSHHSAWPYGRKPVSYSNKIRHPVGMGFEQDCPMGEELSINTGTGILQERFPPLNHENSEVLGYREINVDEMEEEDFEGMVDSGLTYSDHDYIAPNPNVLHETVTFPVMPQLTEGFLNGEEDLSSLFPFSDSRPTSSKPRLSVKKPHPAGITGYRSITAEERSRFGPSQHSTPSYFSILTGRSRPLLTPAVKKRGIRLNPASPCKCSQFPYPHTHKFY